MSEQMFFSLDQAAAMAGVSRDTARRAVNSGALKAKRTGTKELDDGTVVPSGKYLISRDGLNAWFNGLEDA